LTLKRKFVNVPGLGREKSAKKGRRKARKIRKKSRVCPRIANIQQVRRCHVKMESIEQSKGKREQGVEGGGRGRARELIIGVSLMNEPSYSFGT